MPEPLRFRAVVAYDGTAYAGFQRQNERVTVQEVLEAAIEAATRLPATVAPAGRTDAGVHADAQVVAFDVATGLPAEALRHLFDHLLPEDVRVLVVERAPEGFDPQRHAVRKLYRYALRTASHLPPRLRRLVWHVPGPLDEDAMRDAAARVVGTHDFRAFRNDPGPERRGEDTVRTLESLEVAPAEDGLRVDASAPGFLYMMVRNLAAALVAVGRGERPPSWAADVLASRDRRLLPPPAPACGLTLVRVEYPDGFGSLATARERATRRGSGSAAPRLG